MVEDSPEVKQAKEALKRITDEEKLIVELDKGIKSGACVNMDHATIVIDVLEGILNNKNTTNKKEEKEREKMKVKSKKTEDKEGKSVVLLYLFIVI